MMDHLSGMSAAWPKQTAQLSQVFRDTAASYKFFWFLGLLSVIERDKRSSYSQEEIIREMIVFAWSPVCFYRLSLGVQDNLQQTVKELQVMGDLTYDAKPDQVRTQVAVAVDLQSRICALGDLVPTRFLSPWFASKLRGADGHRRTRSIYELAALSQASENPTPYFFNPQNRKVIELNESWRGFLLHNVEVLRSFAQFNLCRYLQARNPNVPGIINKLTTPTERDLAAARRFWREVRTEFTRRGESQLFTDIYTGEPLEAEYSIDHFLPWSFVAHDLLWNLTPVARVTNSRKSDCVPDLQVYLPKLAQLHRRAIQVVANRPKMLEDYVNCFQEPVEEVIHRDERGFLEHYRRLFDPQIQIAVNQGFTGNWILTN